MQPEHSRLPPLRILSDTRPRASALPTPERARIAIATAMNGRELYTPAEHHEQLIEQVTRLLDDVNGHRDADLRGCSSSGMVCDALLIASRILPAMAHESRSPTPSIGELHLPACVDAIERGSILAGWLNRFQPQTVAMQTPSAGALDVSGLDARGLQGREIRLEPNAARAGDLDVVLANGWTIQAGGWAGGDAAGQVPVDPCRANNKHVRVPAAALGGGAVPPHDQPAVRDLPLQPGLPERKYSIGGHPAEPRRRSDAVDGKQPDAPAAGLSGVANLGRPEQYLAARAALEGRAFPPGAPAAAHVQIALGVLFDKVGALVGDQFAALASIFVQTVTSAPDSRQAQVVSLRTGTRGKDLTDYSNEGLVVDLNTPAAGPDGARIFDNPDVARHFCELAKMVSTKVVACIRCHDETTVLPVGIGHLLSHTRLATYVELSAGRHRELDCLSLGPAFRNQIQIRDCDRADTPLMIKVPVHARVVPDMDFPEKRDVSIARGERGEPKPPGRRKARVALRWPSGLLQVWEGDKPKPSVGSAKREGAGSSSSQDRKHSTSRSRPESIPLDDLGAGRRESKGSPDGASTPAHRVRSAGILDDSARDVRGVPRGPALPISAGNNPSQVQSSSHPVVSQSQSQSQSQSVVRSPESQPSPPTISEPARDQRGFSDPLRAMSSPADPQKPKEKTAEELEAEQAEALERQVLELEARDEAAKGNEPPALDIREGHFPSPALNEVEEPRPDGKAEEVRAIMGEFQALQRELHRGARDLGSEWTRFVSEAGKVVHDPKKTHAKLSEAASLFMTKPIERNFVKLKNEIFRVDHVEDRNHKLWRPWGSVEAMWTANEQVAPAIAQMLTVDYFKDIMRMVPKHGRFYRHEPAEPNGFPDGAG